MPYIFRFHKGTNNNIYDWRVSDRITPGHLQDINDKTNVLSSSAGTSIPTPLARLFLFKTAFEIMAAQVRKNAVETQSIYAGLVSESMDLLELLFKSGADSNKFRYQRWTFENNDEAMKHFGSHPGHKLLATSFKQAASQYPFDQRIEITLIYYKESGKEVLIGGTSPFTFVFTSPNFKRKMLSRGFKPVKGMVSNDVLFDSAYMQLQDRDGSFIKYMESLINTPAIGDSFKGISEYVSNTAKRYADRFDGPQVTLSDIRVGDTALIAGQIALKQVSEIDLQAQIQNSSDFKIDLPKDSHYKGALIPLFLMNKMAVEGQYSSVSNLWSSNHEVSELEYPENTIKEILSERELPGLSGIRYPFFAPFDFFEPLLIKLPGYLLNDQRFLTLQNNQAFLYPIKPIFFHLFPSYRIKEYLLVEEVNNDIRFTIKVPIFGPTKGARQLTCTKTYTKQQMLEYEGILGIFPFTRTEQEALLFTNQYTVASYEKTNAPHQLDSIRFFKKDAAEPVPATPMPRSNYTDINTKTIYYQVSKAFDIIQLNFKYNNSKTGGIILPIFHQVHNGEAEYIYAIDFGTSNTHVEYGMVVDKRVTKAVPFEIDQQKMQMFLLNKPNRLQPNDGESYMDYERSTGTKIDKARLVTLREFVPFQIGAQKSASVKFPFRTATSESNNFITSATNDRLFVDANIGFNIDHDQMAEGALYKTDLKWLLQKASNDPFNINRVSVFARELLLIIRTKVLLEDTRGNLKKLKIVLSFPISMGESLRNKLLDIFDKARVDVLGPDSLELAQPVTESIAPYYELKSKNINIQNDNFCNIDIGGGTTDIVLTQTENSQNSNQLQCYCASFRFAGRQLWSSGVDEYNAADNGFVAYYKRFIPNVQTDESLADPVRIFSNQSIKTEDIAGLLFSSPYYKFKDIFTEEPAFRVVPLIHYAAILFYISKLSAWKNVELPRTISFSGKGSEYLNLLFPSGVHNNNADLRGFTQKMLSIFSGKPSRSDFIIEKSHEPKVITARGAVYYAAEDIKDDQGNDWDNTPTSVSNSSEKRLFKENIIFKGFKTLAYEDGPISYDDLARNDALYRDIMSNQIEFVNLLFGDPVLADIINKKLEITNFGKYKTFFIPETGDIYQTGVLRDSFKATVKAFDPQDKVEDPPFFFALNYSLIALSKQIADNAKL